MNEITNNPSVPSQVVADVKFPKFMTTLGIIPTSYKDSMSYYECLAWLCKFLEETVIPTVNQNGLAVEELQSLYVQLNEYVTNYFDNLDVQEEINNKLDDMVEQGVLQEIIAEYLDSTALWCFDNVEDMKESSNLINGSFARTFGFYSVNDNGKALYKIRNITNEDVVDNMTIIPIGTGTLIAELIIENSMLPEQFGAKGDNETDDSTVFAKMVSLGIEIKLQQKEYLADITANDNIKITGKGKNSKINGHIIINKYCVLENFYVNGQITLNNYGNGGNEYNYLNNITVRQTDTTKDCFEIKCLEARVLNCTASNGLNGFNLTNVSNRIDNCSSYFNMNSGFKVSQGTNFLTQCKSWLNARSGTGYGYELLGQDITCDSCSSQQNHRGSFYLTNGSIVSNVNVLGDNIDKAENIAVFTLNMFHNTLNPFGPIISGIVEAKRTVTDWDALTPIIFNCTSTQKAVYMKADITLTNATANDVTILGSGMTGLEDITINGSPLTNNVYVPISFEPISALPADSDYYSYNNLVKSNTSSSRKFENAFTDFLVESCYVSADFETEKDDGILSIFLVKEDDSEIGAVYKSGIKRDKRFSNLMTTTSDNKFKAIRVSINGRENGKYDIVKNIRINVVS